MPSSSVWNPQVESALSHYKGKKNPLKVQHMENLSNAFHKKYLHLVPQDIAGGFMNKKLQ